MLCTVDWVGLATDLDEVRQRRWRRRPASPPRAPATTAPPATDPAAQIVGMVNWPAAMASGRLGEHRREDAHHRDADLDDDDPHGAPPVEQQADRPGEHHAEDQRRHPRPHHRVVPLPGQPRGVQRGERAEDVEAAVERLDDHRLPPAGALRARAEHPHRRTRQLARRCGPASPSSPSVGPRRRGRRGRPRARTRRDPAGRPRRPPWPCSSSRGRCGPSSPWRTCRRTPGRTAPSART